MSHGSSASDAATARSGSPGTREVDRLVGLLEDHEVSCWVDSGVLLGLTREGGLLSWEKDIDLGVTADQIAGLVRLRPQLEQLGYDTHVLTYRRKPYALALNPIDGDAHLRAAVHVFYPIGDWLWSPQPQMYAPPPAPDLVPHPTVTGRALRGLMRRWIYTDAAPNAAIQAPSEHGVVAGLARTVFRRVDQGDLAETWPLREVLVPFTWVLPRELVLPLRSVEVAGRSYPVPHDVEGYLTYRYGDWRTPRTDWAYWRDDGAIRHENPVEVAQALRAAASSRSTAPSSRRP